MFRRRIINCNFRGNLPVLMVLIMFSTCSAQEGNSKDDQSASQSSQSEASSGIASADPSSVWQYGAFLDFGYIWDNNHPANETFRTRGTAYKVDVPLINMAGAHLRKTVSESSRWGTELTVQAGQDTRVFGFSATAPNMPGYRGLRHLGPTNISYLAPVGRGLTIQGGIFSSFIGYDSLYTKDNWPPKSSKRQIKQHSRLRNIGKREKRNLHSCNRFSGKSPKRVAPPWAWS